MKATVLSAVLAVLLMASPAHAQSKQPLNHAKMETVYVETGKMKLKAGVTDEQFKEIERNIRKGIINQQPGFLGREFGKDTEGFWYFILRWDSKEHADAWTPIFQKDANGQAMMIALDFSTVRQEHFTVVKP